MQLRSFQGLVPAPELAAEVAAVPYDVVNRAESKVLGEGNPINLIHVDRAEIDLPDEVGDYDDAVYVKAAENFKKLQSDGVLVVAWTRRVINGSGTWLRWQSPQLTTRGELDQAWQRADIWSQNPSDEEKTREVAVTPLEEWQIFYFRGDAWTNPLSSDVTTPGAVPNPQASTTAGAVPDGVRLVLTLPPGQAISGRLTRDWVRPTLSANKP